MLHQHKQIGRHSSSVSAKPKVLPVPRTKPPKAVTESTRRTSEKQPFERIEVSRVEALQIFAENKFKVEIINELPEDKTITVYRCGPLVDLCRGPHILNTSFVKAFACLKASASYIGDEKQTVRACRECLEFLSLILNVSRNISI